MTGRAEFFWRLLKDVRVDERSRFLYFAGLYGSLGGLLLVILVVEESRAIAMCVGVFNGLVLLCLLALWFFAIH